MKKKLTSESGIFISRVVFGVVLGAMAIWFAMLALRAQPAPQSSSTFQLAGGSIAVPNGWTPRNYANMHELWNATPDRIASVSAQERDEIARIRTGLTPTKDHAEALHRLQEIEAESKTASQYVSIGGWPALVRRQLIDKPREGDTGTDDGKLFMVTTAIAAGNTVVRMDGFAPETASLDLVKQMETIGRSWQPPVAGDEATAAREIRQLSSS